MSKAPFAIRAAEPRDLEAIVRLITGLAEFEKLTHLLAVTPKTLRPHLFGERPVAEALVVDRGEGGWSRSRSSSPTSRPSWRVRACTSRICS